jgi:PTH1 family peptidyl-tRNA hydrolase
MTLIVGLGNPGPEYDGTRHNIGFHVLFEVAEKLGIRFQPGKGPFMVATGSHKGRKVALVLPTTYMNLSGQAVSKALKVFDIALMDCLVVTDDLNLPVGKVRIRSSGSDGGHNGLSSIITTVNSDQFPRLRFGIGNDFPRGRQADYVLSAFNPDEQDAVQAGVDRSVDAVLCFIREGIVTTMNTYN